MYTYSVCEVVPKCHRNMSVCLCGLHDFNWSSSHQPPRSSQSCCKAGCAAFPKHGAAADRAPNIHLGFRGCLASYGHLHSAWLGGKW